MLCLIFSLIHRRWIRHAIPFKWALQKKTQHSLIKQILPEAVRRSNLDT